MIEYLSKALVLDVENIGELDKLVYLYTEKLGKVVARAKSIRKITSKLTGHLQPFNFVRVRLVEKNGFQVVDALAFNKVEISDVALTALQFIKDMTFELQPDKQLWLTIKKSFDNLKKNKKFFYKPLLKVLGFSPDFSRCNVCDSKFVAYFSKTEQVFLCSKCALPHYLPSIAKPEIFSDLIKI